MSKELRAARENKGWSREELASRAGLDVQVVKRLEGGIGSLANMVTAMKALELHLIGIGKGATISQQIGNRRARLGLTIDQVAARAQISRATLGALELGRGTIAPLDKVMSVLAPGARAALPVRASFNYDRAVDRDKRFTPASFLAHVVAAFGPIDLDPCGHALAAVKARRTIMLPGDGLAESWAGARLAFVNPPFSDLIGWLNRAVDAFESGECAKVVILIPTRTDSATFHDRVIPLADIAFLRGRMRFDAPTGTAYPAPFAMMVLILGGADREIERFAELVPATWLRRLNSPK